MNSPFSTPWQTGLKEAFQERTSIFVLSDSNLPPQYLEEVLEVCGADLPINTHSIPGGEQIKTLAQAELLYRELDSAGVERKTLMVCLGGGTITDLGGFVASTYKRGMDLVLLPTTLLSMVDAAIGGKNGVNLSTPEGLVKNQVGTFYLPKFIGLNPDWLRSLDPREIRSGWAEMAKHALLSGADGLLDDLLKINKISADNLGPLITRAAELKHGIVNEDPLENGPRAALNLGHTVGHALEALAMETSKHITHGEGVAWGLVFMLEASIDKLGFDVERGASLSDWIIKSINEPIELPMAGKIWAIMLKDKKNQFGNVTDILLRSEGEVMLDFVWNEEEFTILWEQFHKKYA
jgi:3-dehydroquinate synthase